DIETTDAQKSEDGNLMATQQTLDIDDTETSDAQKPEDENLADAQPTSDSANTASSQTAETTQTSDQPLSTADYWRRKSMQTSNASSPSSNTEEIIPTAVTATAPKNLSQDVNKSSNYNPRLYPDHGKKINNDIRTLGNGYNEPNSPHFN
ncbi:MAG: hypothetical protein K2Q14_07620, partial [Gammaproteobacteria bacterium]|nr:hypothetical protein [Gammaproteobacteria bacterium]